VVLLRPEEGIDVVAFQNSTSKSDTAKLTSFGISFLNVGLT